MAAENAEHNNSAYVTSNSSQMVKKSNLTSYQHTATTSTLFPSLSTTKKMGNAAKRYPTTPSPMAMNAAPYAQSWQEHVTWSATGHRPIHSSARSGRH